MKISVPFPMAKYPGENIGHNIWLDVGSQFQTEFGTKTDEQGMTNN